MTVEPAGVSVGEVVAGKYRIQGTLGSGAMGTVYRALQLSLNRVVALKMMRSGVEHAWSGRRRFSREAELLTKLRHPNLVPLYDIDLEGDSPFIAMELVEGPSLLDVLERPERHPVPDPVEVAMGLAEGLSYIHAQGVVHRDIKPANILLKDGRVPMLADFGLARHTASSVLTTEGFVVGTPAYLAPNPSTDLYQLGLVLYELVSGKLFVERIGPDIQQILTMRLEGRVRPLSEAAPDCQPALARAVMRCLEKDPRRRFASAAELLAALKPLSAGSDEQVSAGAQVTSRSRAVSASGVRRGQEGRGKEGPETDGVLRQGGVRHRSLLVAGAVVVAVLMAMVGGGLALRRPASVVAGASSRESSAGAPGFAPLALQDVDWSYDAGRLRARCKVSAPLLDGYTYRGQDTRLPAPTALLEASMPYTAGTSFELALLRSDGGPPIRLTEGDLEKALRTAGDRLTRTLRDFWQRTGLTDQSYVNELRSCLSSSPASSGQHLQSVEAFRGVLGERMRILEPVRQFLRCAPLYFDTRAIPAIERTTLYKYLAPLQLADSLAYLHSIAPPFSQEIAGRLGTTFEKLSSPDVTQTENYLLGRTKEKELLGTSHTFPIPPSHSGTTILVGAAYRFESAGIVKICINKVPVYLSRMPARFFTERFDIKARLAIIGNAPSNTWSDNARKVNWVALGQRLDPYAEILYCH
ncbi:MAG: serine/threonine protein kinase [Candidatus Wallbacteria bacterium]|nr:serine/threonine protein kinase [Candidatus Wallbacteria bacterium]